MAESSKAAGGERQRKKTYKYDANRGGGRGGGRGGTGGRGGGRGRGGNGGGGGGRGGGRGGHFGGGAPSGPWDGTGSSKPSHLGRYREDPLPDLINAPGILVTAVQNKERSAERELVEALEQIADELYPETSDTADTNEIDENEDMEAMLKRELSGMASDQRSKRFRLCRHETPCLFYITVLSPLDPVKLVDRLLRRIESTARCPFKFVSRVVPISATSQATLHQLKAISMPVIKQGFQTADNAPLKFAVVVNSRNSQKLERLEMIKTVAENVELLEAGHSVDLGKPDRTIIIELAKNSIGVSVVLDYDRLKKVRAPKRKRRTRSTADRQYNVVQIAKGAATATAIATGPAEEGTALTSTGEVQNRAGKVEVSEKRKAEELDGGSAEAMEVKQSETTGGAVAEDSEAARAAKQQRI